MGLANKCGDMLSLLKQLTVEPYLFLVLFGIVVRLVTFQDLLASRSCRLNLNYSESICDDLDNHAIVKNEAQKMGNNMYVGITLFSTVPAVVVATFVGPWSDKYGRRIPLICASLGSLVDSVLVALLTSSPTIRPEFFFVSALFSGICGGLIISISCAYSYLSDITDEKSRPTRFAILQSFFILASPLGTVIGGQIFSAGGYMAVISTSPIVFGLAFLWATFMLKEARPRHHTITRRQMLRDLASLDNVRENIKTSIVKRPGNLRLQIWLLILASCCKSIVFIGSLSIGYYYTKKMYNWGVTTYSNVSTIFNVCSALMTVTFVPFMSRSLLLHEAAIGLVGTLSAMAKVVILSADSDSQSVFCYGWFAGLLESCSSIAVRSRLSKLVSKKEQGRIFSLLATCEALAPVLGTALFSQLYNASIDIYPGLAYAVAAVLLLIPASIFAWMTRMPTISFGELLEIEEKENVKELKVVAADDTQKV